MIASKQKKDYTRGSIWDDNKSSISCDCKYPAAQVRI